MPQGIPNGPEERFIDDDGEVWLVPTYTGLPPGICNHCGGDGYTLVAGFGGDYNHNCGKCKGTGKITVPTQSKTIWDHLLEDAK